jgi:sigma-B regulation protein RsbU (phosphoserine phosphatase)
MEHFVYAVVILVMGALAGTVWIRERREKSRIAREKTAIEVEERRMFGFLHGLGERLQEDSSPSNMHRYVVEGVAEVIGADAGILYLLDGDTNQLVPVSQSERVPPVLPVPEEVLALKDDSDAKGQYRGFLRLSALSPDGNIIGETMAAGGVLHLPDLKEHNDFREDSSGWQEGVSFLGAPLVYGRKRVGVLAMTKHDGEFTQNDQEVFDSVSEQSSFALGSAIIHVEAAEKRRLEMELTQASEIQRVLLPRSSPALSDYEIAADYRAARIVSGDYYDYLRIDEDRYGIAIGDVCGKGIAASLIMAMCRSNLRGRSPENLSPASVLHEVNRSIFPDIKEDMFVSLLYLILERGSNEVTMARAGHEPPLLFRKASGEVEMIEPPGLAAGVDRGPVFKRAVKDHRFTMESGDILLLYTDGVTEYENRVGDEFGLDRLSSAVEKFSDCSSEELVQSITGEVVEFSAGMAQTDDITLIAIEKR